MNALAEACTKCYGNSDGGVINSCWEGSGKVTEKSLHLEGDRKFSQRLGGRAVGREAGIPGTELSRIKAKESASARGARAAWRACPGAPRVMFFPSVLRASSPNFPGSLLDIHIQVPPYLLI